MGPLASLLRSGVLLVLAALGLGCATTPTGRSQLVLFSETQMAQMGQAAFMRIQGERPASVDVRANRIVRCVAGAITSGLRPDEVQGLGVTSWQVVVFNDPSANAFALPGGSIGVHKGLLDVARNQHQLATVLGHEVAHVLARHGNERVSQAAVVQSGVAAAQILMGPESREQLQLMGLLGAGAQVGVILPFSRLHESEADLIGLELMARAGFDPAESIALWQNMAAAAGPGGRPPELLSTHPSPATRIADLEAALPFAEPRAREARAAGRRPDCR